MRGLPDGFVDRNVDVDKWKYLGEMVFRNLEHHASPQHQHVRMSYPNFDFSGCPHLLRNPVDRELRAVVLCKCPQHSVKTSVALVLVRESSLTKLQHFSTAVVRNTTVTSRPLAGRQT